MWKQSENIVHRLFSRQINRAPPNTHINKTRQLYENIVPSFTVYDVECPEQLWRCFTNDGQYLICFSRNLHDVLIYRPCWLSYCPAPDSVDELPIKAKKFESYFTLLHQIPLVSGQTELLCKDFFLATENNVYGIFAASTIQDTNPAAATGAVPTVPSVEKTTFFLVRLADGVVTDQRVFHDDYIHLAHNAGVFLHDDLLAVLSVRFQCIHILQVRDGGLFLDVRTIGNFCCEDDELLLNSQSQEEVLTEGSQILGGLKQRLLSFIMQGIQDENVSPGVRARLLQRFYYHFQHYVDLVMWKVQFLDRHHLLIKFGSLEGLLQQRNTDTSQQTSFLAVYNLETTKMLAFYQNSAEEMLQLVEHYYDYFRMALPIPTYMNFISSYGNNIFSQEQLRKQKTTSCVCMQVIRRTLSVLPFNCQSQSPSAYFDQYLFHYDEKFISAIDRHKPCMEHPIKFISRRRPNTLKFKINPGLELGANDGQIRRVASFLFHPVFPFAISVQQSFLQATVVNFHFRH
ncbi:unnamed protein product [Sphagnum troendelagicum]|uniref:Light-mediated development protein DET1 n=1 Tax=Sphagnum troendelagicum TaxID=128251 RepID=A0ABP0TET8_9BRYO